MFFFSVFDYAFLRRYTWWAIHCSVRYTSSSLLGLVTSPILLLCVSQCLCLFVIPQVSTCISSSVPLCMLLVHSLCVPSISRAFCCKLFQAFLPCVPRGYLVGMMHSYGSCAFTPGTPRVFLFLTPCVPYLSSALYFTVGSPMFLFVRYSVRLVCELRNSRFSPCVYRSFRELSFTFCPCFLIFSYEFLNGSLGAPCYSPCAFLVPKFRVHSICFSFRFLYFWFYTFLALPFSFLTYVRSLMVLLWAPSNVSLAFWVPHVFDSLCTLQTPCNSRASL